MRRTARLGVWAAPALLVLSGCGSGGSAKDPGQTAPSPSAEASDPGSAPASGSPSARSVVITIKDFEFAGPASVPAGAKVMVRNDDGEAHTVTDDQGGAFDIKVDPGATVSFTAPSRPGSYPYHCTYHSNMQATLKVS